MGLGCCAFAVAAGGLGGDAAGGANLVARDSLVGVGASALITGIWYTGDGSAGGSSGTMVVAENAAAESDCAIAEAMVLGCGVVVDVGIAPFCVST